MTDTINHHYWQGAFIGDDEAADRLAALPAAVEAALAEPLDTETVLAACDALAAALRDPGHAVRDRLAPHLPAGDAEDAAALYAELAAFLDRSALTRKLRRELGGAAPQRLNRPDAKETVYEAWAPVGLVAHIAPGNAATVAPLSVVEGLLAGNVNVLKTSGTDTLLAPHLLAELVAQDPTGALAERVIVLRFPSSRQDWLRLMCAPRTPSRSGAASPPWRASPPTCRPAAGSSNGDTRSPSPTSPGTPGPTGRPWTPWPRTSASSSSRPAPAPRSSTSTPRTPANSTRSATGSPRPSPPGPRPPTRNSTRPSTRN